MKHPSRNTFGASLVVLALAAPLALAQSEQSVEEDAEQALENAEQGVEGAVQEGEEALENAEQEVEEAVQEGEQAMENAEQEVEEEVGDADMAEAALTEGEPVEGQIVLQSENTILAADLIGLTVYSPTDEEVGEINDLIVSFEGVVEGVIVGVGGFLGIGEKDVAIEMQALELIPDEEEEPRLVLSTTKEELEAAPGFVTRSEQEAEAEAEAAREQLEADAATTAPLPEEPVDPATTTEAQ